ncbi:Ger(x)C family spore germination protein [Bacillus rubiinfantis]|uniref:Ger(x)C family spore germination protein n=1 Tax=Bacillus rubiinfantis TaxID=1499680 RepID=UPI0005AA9460|nr:Ger(x)C family spore germination protein [Bacillus rubiinfantis]
MKRRMRLIFSILLLIPLLTGCWDQNELTDLALVMAVGIDKGENGDKFDVSFQIVVPSNVASGQMGGGGGEGPPVIVFKSSGNNVTEAARKIKLQISRRLFFAHISIVAISEEVARENILDIIDGFDREPQFRTTTPFVITRDIKAEELLATLTNLDKLPAEKLTKTLEVTEARLGENLTVSLDDFLIMLTSNGKEPVLGGFTIRGNPEKGISLQELNDTKMSTVITGAGIAVFNTDKLVGWLDDGHARGAAWLMNKVKQTFINVPFAGKENAISMVPYVSDTTIGISMRNGKPVANIKIETALRLSEVNIPFDFQDPKKVPALQKNTAEQIKKDVEAAIRQAQSYHADIFGFGERLYRKNPKQWKKVKENWNELFATMDYRVSVKTYFRESGSRNKPFWNEIKK